VGLKVDTSFLKFLTMGASGVRRVAELMTQAGLQPIELERYSRSNKIWQTKVKRLRLPDLLCVRTGLRAEVRAKTALAIKMSDAPNNPERRWNSGLVAGDMIAFVLIREAENGVLQAAENAELFWVEDLVGTETESKLGPPKSASEGAEQDREWPSTVAKSAGVVLSLDEGRLATRLDLGRNQTYHLDRKTAYFVAGQRFLAESQFLAGIPMHKAAFPNPHEVQWNPRNLLASQSPIDRYVAVKALGVVGSTADVKAVTQIAEHDQEVRVALEAAVALARLGRERGLELLRNAVANPAIAFLRMEAVLALSELAGTPLAPQCAQILSEYARSDCFVGDEVRQAAIWGLGKDGLEAYNSLLDFLDADADDERVHAICAFGSDGGSATADSLVAAMITPSSTDRRRASASFVLAGTIPTEISAPRVIVALKSPDRRARNWALATLGQMDPTLVREYVNDPTLAAQLEPLQLASPETNWTRAEQLMDKLAFVRKQTVIECNQLHTHALRNDIP
jgi:HEAT repeat protein